MLQLVGNYINFIFCFSYKNINIGYIELTNAIVNNIKREHVIELNFSNVGLNYYMFQLYRSFPLPFICCLFLCIVQPHDILL